MEIYVNMDGKSAADHGDINADVRISSAMPQPVTTRWNPTPEQLMILEELYRGGIRTPNADHIQRITAYLSLYGKIEGKNVFYWFQNHKARDRQKLRRKMDKKHKILGTFQEESVGHEMQNDHWKLGTNSTGETCTPSISENEWEVMDITGATTTTRARPLKTLELFPLCSGNLSNEKQTYSNSLSDCRLFVEEDRQQ